MLLVVGRGSDRERRANGERKRSHQGGRKCDQATNAHTDVLLTVTVIVQQHLPGRSIHCLIARSFSPPPQRYRRRSTDAHAVHLLFMILRAVHTFESSPTRALVSLLLITAMGQLQFLPFRLLSRNQSYFNLRCKASVRGFILLLGHHCAVTGTRTRVTFSSLQTLQETMRRSVLLIPLNGDVARVAAARLDGTSVEGRGITSVSTAGWPGGWSGFDTCRHLRAKRLVVSHKHY